MQLDIFNGRTCLIDFNDEQEKAEVILEAVRTLSLAYGSKYFIGYGRMFFVRHEDETISVHCYRENWNGYHDNYRIYPDGTVDYSVIQSNYSEGRHRQSFPVS